MPPRNAKRKSYSQTGERTVTRSRSKLNSLLRVESSAPASPQREGFSGVPAAWPATSSMTAKTFNHCASLRSTEMLKEAEIFSSPDPVGKTVNLDEAKDNLCSDNSAQLQAVLDNMLGSLFPAAKDSTAVSPGFANQYFRKPLASRSPVRGNKTGEDIAFVGTVDKATHANDGTNDGQVSLEFATQNEEYEESNGDAFPSALIINPRVVDAPPLASSNLAIEQVPVLEVAVASNVAGGRADESSCNPNLNVEPPCQTSSVGLTEMVNMWADEDSGDEVEFPASVVSEYRVKEKYAPTLRKIVEKYGDIAVSYIMETPAGRSLALENVCDLIQTLQDKKFCGVTVFEIEKILALVHDFENAGLKVDWLKQRLEDILEARELVKQSSTLKEERDRCHQVVIEKKSQVEAYESQILALQVKLSSAQKELDAARIEAGKIREKVSNAKRKVAQFAEHPLLDKLL